MTMALLSVSPTVVSPNSPLYLLFTTKYYLPKLTACRHVLLPVLVLLAHSSDLHPDQLYGLRVHLCLSLQLLSLLLLQGLLPEALLLLGLGRVEREVDGVEPAQLLGVIPELLLADTHSELLQCLFLQVTLALSGSRACQVVHDLWVDVSLHGGESLVSSLQVVGALIPVLVTLWWLIYT
jgi:hypothetical protein